MSITTPVMNTHTPRQDEQGTILLIALGLVFSLSAACTLYLSASNSARRTSAFEHDLLRSRRASEEGIYRSIDELRLITDGDSNGMGNITFVGQDSREIIVGLEPLGGDLYRVRSRGQHPLAAYTTDALIQVIPSDPLSLDARAAITARGPVTTTGSIMVDGRDWAADGSGLVGPGTFGISTTYNVTRMGSSTIGGNGSAPAKTTNPAIIEEFANWANGIDEDGDGATDEEAWDNIDNDGDGLIDEDTNSFPETPDAAFKIPEGTLKAAAMAQGTYFTSAAAANAYFVANGGHVPGGKIIYCEFGLWEPVAFGGALNADPSLVIHHLPDGSAHSKNIHGELKGMFIADYITHINGDFMLLGAVMTFAPDAIGNAYGNGNADIRFSSEVLGNLPTAQPQTQKVRILSWSKAPEH